MRPMLEILAGREGSGSVTIAGGRGPDGKRMKKGTNVVKRLECAS